MQPCRVYLTVSSAQVGGPGPVARAATTAPRRYISSCICRGMVWPRSLFGDRLAGFMSFRGLPLCAGIAPTRVRQRRVLPRHLAPLPCALGEMATYPPEAMQSTAHPYRCSEPVLPDKSAEGGARVVVLGPQAV